MFQELVSAKMCHLSSTFAFIKPFFGFVHLFLFPLFFVCITYPSSLSFLLYQVSSLLGDPSRLLMQKALSLRPPGLVQLGKGLLGDSPTGKHSVVVYKCA